MPDFCAAIGCSNERNARTKQQGITFHRFPRDKLKRQVWTVALRRRDYEPNDRSVVCSHHFKSEDFDKTGQTTRLREGVIPSVFIFTNQLHKGPSTSSSNHTSHSSTIEHLDVLEPKDLDESASEIPDHLYALDPLKVKERLTEAQEKLQELRRDLRNAKDRERRHKKTMKTLLKDLKQKHMLTEELQQKLDVILVG